MSYLFIKEDDSKVFKSFMSGNEIEVGILVSAKTDEFNAGKEIEIFYGDENTSSYRAEIKRLMSSTPTRVPNKALLRMSVVKV